MHRMRAASLRLRSARIFFNEPQQPLLVAHK